MLRFLTAGESHGPEIVALIEGMPAGLHVDVAEIDRDLRRRQGGYGRGARSTRIERDEAHVVGGLSGGVTTGAPIAIRIENRDFVNQPDTPRPMSAPRPGHADLAGGLKYGVRDFRLIRERASARETAARVAAGAVFRQLLRRFGTEIGSFVVEVAGVKASLPGAPAESHDQTVPSWDSEVLSRLGRQADGDPLRCPDPDRSKEMMNAIDAARADGDTVGGIFWVFAVDVLAGLGSHVQWDRRLDGRLAQALCSIPGVKGAEVGPAFQVSGLRGSEAHDGISMEDGILRRTSNRAGGLEGGITNGEPLLLRAAMKPLSSLRAPVQSVDFETGRPAMAPHVRSDVCSVPAAAVVGEAMMAAVLADALTERVGGDRMDAMLAANDSIERYNALGFDREQEGSGEPPQSR